MQHITQLKPNEVFVFGSNLAGRHGKGAAKQALISFGAVYGQGEGLQGQAYAIPTKDYGVRTLPLNKIKPYVDRFITFAKERPELIFLVTDIGCGLAGFKPEEIAPMFDTAKGVSNIKLPEVFEENVR